MVQQCHPQTAPALETAEAAIEAVCGNNRSRASVARRILQANGDPPGVAAMMISQIRPAALAAAEAKVAMDSLHARAPSSGSPAAYSAWVWRVQRAGRHGIAAEAARDMVANHGRVKEAAQLHVKHAALRCILGLPVQLEQQEPVFHGAQGTDSARRLVGNMAADYSLSCQLRREEARRGAARHIWDTATALLEPTLPACHVAGCSADELLHLFDAELPEHVRGAISAANPQWEALLVRAASSSSAGAMGSVRRKVLRVLLIGCALPAGSLISSWCTDNRKHRMCGGRII